MSYKKLSNEEEQTLVKEYIEGVPVQTLMVKYGFKTKKSITDKVKKYHKDDFKEMMEQARIKRKGYNYKFEKIQNEFDAYFLGSLLTDGYVNPTRNEIGLDLTDEDCIKFISDTVGKSYHGYDRENRKTRYRIVLSDKELVDNISKYGVVPNKSLVLQGPSLSKEEEKFLPYLIRGIIDGDGNVTPTSYGAPAFKIYSASKDFIEWAADVLQNKLFMKDINILFAENEHNGLYHVQSANFNNILTLINLCYDKPFGMRRKYEEIRKTFNDYNGCSLFAIE